MIVWTLGAQGGGHFSHGPGSAKHHHPPTYQPLTSNSTAIHLTLNNQSSVPQTQSPQIRSCDTKKRSKWIDTLTIFTTSPPLPRHTHPMGSVRPFFAPKHHVDSDDAWCPDVTIPTCSPAAFWCSYSVLWSFWWLCFGENPPLRGLEVSLHTRVPPLRRETIKNFEIKSPSAAGRAAMLDTHDLSKPESPLWPPQGWQLTSLPSVQVLGSLE